MPPCFFSVKCPTFIIWGNTWPKQSPHRKTRSTFYSSPLHISVSNDLRYCKSFLALYMSTSKAIHPVFVFSAFYRVAQWFATSVARFVANLATFMSNCYLNFGLATFSNVQATLFTTLWRSWSAKLKNWIKGIFTRSKMQL